MKLLELFDFLPKSKHSASYGACKGLYPFFTSSNRIDSFVDLPDYDGEYLIIGDGGSGNCKYYSGLFSASDHNYVLKPKSGCNAKCVKYFLMKGNYEILNKGFKGVGIKNITKSYIQNIDYSFNNQYTEDQIVISLTKIDLLIQNEKAVIDKLDLLVKSRFIEMFGDPILNSKNLPMKKVIDVVTMQRGFDLPIQDRNPTGQIPLYGANGLIDYHDVAKINEGIITGRSGTIGEVYYSKVPFWPLNTTLFSNNNHGNNIVYLKYLLTFFKLSRFSSGSGVLTLNRNNFHNEMIIDVPIELQNDFASFIEIIDKLKFKAQERIKLYQELLNKKMDEYFN